MIGVKFPVLYVWPATVIKCLIFPVIMRMHFAFASDRTQTHTVDFRKISVTRIRKICVRSYPINHQHFLHPL